MRLQVSILLLFFFSTIQLNSQRYLSVQTVNDPKTLKYDTGDVLEFKIADSDEWFKGEITKIMVEENVIIVDGLMVNIEDITHIGLRRKKVNIASKMAQTFGLGWLVFGGLGALSGNSDFDTSTAVIGGGSILLGWLFKKLFYKRIMVIGDRYSLKLLDLSLD